MHYPELAGLYSTYLESVVNQRGLPTDHDYQPFRPALASIQIVPTDTDIRLL